MRRILAACLLVASGAAAQEPGADFEADRQKLNALHEAGDYTGFLRHYVRVIEGTDFISPERFSLTGQMGEMTVRLIDHVDAQDQVEILGAAIPLVEEDEQYLGRPYLYITYADAQMQVGDVEGAVRSLDEADTAMERFDSLGCLPGANVTTCPYILPSISELRDRASNLRRELEG